jgi:hypothetical protein
MVAPMPSEPLQVHTRWSAPDDGPGSALVFATEPGRRRIGLRAPLLVALVGLLAWALGVPGLVVIAVVAASLLAATFHTVGGSAGYYEMPDDGPPIYLGWRVPDLRGRRRARVPAGDTLALP